MSGDDTPTGEDVTDPREMRKQLLELSLTGSMPGHRKGVSSCGAMVRNCMRAGEAMGLSGEDTYTLMAWCLLHQAMRLEKMVLDELMLRPSSSFTVPAPPVATGTNPVNF